MAIATTDDPYIIGAAKVLGKKAEEITPEERQFFKVAFWDVYALAAGMEWYQGKPNNPEGSFAVIYANGEKEILWDGTKSTWQQVIAWARIPMKPQLDYNPRAFQEPDYGFWIGQYSFPNGPEEKVRWLQFGKPAPAPKPDVAAADIADSDKLNYFDVIYHFGIISNSGHSPSESKDHPYRIHVELPGHGQTTAYGRTVVEVYARALEWLDGRDKNWRQLCRT